MSKTTLVLIRHGETEMNVGNVFRGRRDIPLTDNGRTQADQLARALCDWPLTAVYSSPLQRAAETARRVAGPHGLPVTPADEFQNICLGEWEGRSKEEVREEYPRLWKQWVEAPEDLQLAGAETLGDVRERVSRGLGLLMERHAGSTVAVISHRSVLKVALAVILGLERDFFWKFYLDNCSYSLVERHPQLGYTLVCLNETCHLSRRTVETF